MGRQGCTELLLFYSPYYTKQINLLTINSLAVPSPAAVIGQKSEQIQAALQIQGDNSQVRSFFVFFFHVACIILDKQLPTFSVPGRFYDLPRQIQEEIIRVGLSCFVLFFFSNNGHYFFILWASFTTPLCCFSKWFSSSFRTRTQHLAVNRKLWFLTTGDDCKHSGGPDIWNRRMLYLSRSGRLS